MDSSGARPVDAAGGVIVAGMGGSAAGGRLAIGGARPAADATAGRLRRLRAAGLGGAATLVFASSYSGNTEETLAAYDDAVARRAAARGHDRRRPGRARAARRRAGDPAPGGFQPRAAIGYSLVRRSEAAALGGAAPFVREEIEAAAALADALAAEWGPDAPEDSQAKSLARALHGTVPVIAGAELAAAAAYRWKCQFNENAACPAFASVLPEADHNEVVGWDAARHSASFSYVSLEDPGAHPRNALRAELTADTPARARDRCCACPRAARRRSSGWSRSVLLGDLVSIYAAVLRGADPVDIPAIDALKAALAARIGEFSVPEDCGWPATVVGHVLHRLRARFRGRAALTVASIIGGEARATLPAAG